VNDWPDLDAVTADRHDLLSAAETDWSRPVPQCPEWDAAGLTGHMGAIAAWIATIVATGEQVAREDREKPPGEHAALAAWYSARLDRVLGTLAATTVDTPAWTFSRRGERRAGWWRRRLAVELAIHRWDAQHAVSRGGGPPARPLDTAVAAAGIEEFLTEFLPGLLARAEAGELAGTLHLHSTDGPSEWRVDLDARAGASALAGHAKADTAVRGTESDLLLWLTNRRPARDLEVFGRREVADGWTRLCR
jgi:uncharacterized protein (TIGR03083 family)